MAVCSQKYVHPTLGMVNIRVLSTAVRMTARVKDDVVHVTIPPAMSADEFERILAGMVPQLLAMKQPAEQFYRDGYGFANDIISIKVKEDVHVPASTLVRGFEKDMERVADTLADTLVISVPPGALARKSMEKLVAKCILDFAEVIAGSILICDLRSEARRLGIEDRITSVATSRNRSTLGMCSSRGCITLSAYLVFLPADERRAVMTHELAHLRHMDHSDAFYAHWEKLHGAPVRHYRQEYGKYPLPLPRR